MRQITEHRSTRFCFIELCRDRTAYLLELTRRLGGLAPHFRRLCQVLRCLVDRALPLLDLLTKRLYAIADLVELLRMCLECYDRCADRSHTPLGGLYSGRYRSNRVRDTLRLCCLTRKVGEPRFGGIHACANPGAAVIELLGGRLHPIQSLVQLVHRCSSRLDRFNRPGHALYFLTQRLYGRRRSLQLIDVSTQRAHPFVSFSKPGIRFRLAIAKPRHLRRCDPRLFQTIANGFLCAIQCGQLTGHLVDERPCLLYPMHSLGKLAQRLVELPYVVAHYAQSFGLRRDAHHIFRNVRHLRCK